MIQELLQKKDVDDEEEGLISNPLRLFSAQLLDTDLQERKLQEFYSPLPIDCCGFRQDTQDKTAIAAKKKALNKPFVNEFQKDAVPQLLALNDGMYQTTELEKFDTMNAHRLEKRLTRDSREQFYKTNGELIAERDFYEDRVSRLANISFEPNPAVALYQKNATLSIRTNQNKVSPKTTQKEPFQFQVVVGELVFNQHPLMNEEQKEFEQLRPLLEQLQLYSTHPQLPYFSKLTKELKHKHAQLEKKGARSQQLDQLQEQIDRVVSKADQAREQIQSTMRKVLQGWNIVKLKRKAINCMTVPWKVAVKEYTLEGQQQFEIGLTSAPTTVEKDLPPQEKQRKQQMEKEVYFLRLIVNENVVSKTSKLRMNWPHFTLPVYEKFSMFLFTMPSSIRLEVVRNGILQTVIDSIGLKLPGEHAQTLTAAERRLVHQHFYSNGDAVRRGKQQPTGHVGSISYRVQWKGQGAHMPPSNITISDEVSTQDQSEQTKEQETLDVNDPRKLHKLKKAGRRQFPTQVVTKESVLPFEGLISTRQFLLKLRAKNNALSGKRIPLTEDAIRKRQDLMRIIEEEKLANTLSHEPSAERTYNPLEGVFRYQPEETQKRIRDILTKFINNRHAINTGVVSTSYKYRLVDEIINEYTFEQMVSPIVVFFQDLFTQKRKLGPRKVHVPPTRQNILELHIEVHVAGAVNVPARESATNVVGKIRKTRQVMTRQIAETIGIISGLSLFQQQPNMGVQTFQYYNNQTGAMGYGNRGSFMGGMGASRMQPMNIDYNQPQVGDNPHDMLIGIERVTTFVEMLHKRSYRRTNQAEGVAPQWNETMSFPYNMKQQQSSLEQMYYSTGKRIVINLFDINEVSKPTQAIDEISIKKRKFYLGTLEIPLSSLISLPKISGSFKIKRPVILFGYSTVHHPVLSSPEQDLEFRTENPTVATYVNIDVSLSPLIDNSLAYSSDRKFFGGQEDPLFLQHANDWLERLNMKRYIRLWLNNLEGNSIFISRFLVDVEPPPLRTSDFPEKIIERTARFVSLIPQKSACKLLDNTEQFHMTTQQFLDSKMGDDHAILLCNYFNSIDRTDGKQNWESYLLVGKAFPEGKTMYVLRLDKTTLEFEIWNPRTGEAYSFDKQEFETVCCCFTVSRGLKTNTISKDICPLSQVSCVVSKDNVYVNVQPSVNPSEIRYDFNDAKLWKPFLTERSKRELFDRRPLKPYQGIPITKAFYELNRNTHSKEIDQEIFDFICDKFRSERRGFLRPCTFRMNQQISNMIRDRVLIQLETMMSDFRLSGTESKFYSNRQKAEWPAVLDELERMKSQVKDQIDPDRVFLGFPLNMPFTTVQDVWERVSNTQIHLNEKEDMEFVVTVRTFDYPCFVTSVWVFLGVIEEPR